jgi:ribose transport system substrate-binding protein
LAGVIAATALLTAVAGCGSDDDASGESTVDTSESGSTAATDGTESTASTGSETGGTRFAVVEAVVNPFYAPFPKALEDAAADFGIDPVPERNAPQDYDQAQQNAVVDAFVAKGVDGMSIQPVDPVGGNATIERLIEQGINVVGTGACSETNEAGAVVCIEADLYLHAFDATEKLIEAMGEEGNIFHLAGALAGNTTPPRIKGVEDAVAKYPNVKLAQTITDIDTPQAAQAAVSNLLASEGDNIDGVISTAYNTSVAWANAMTQEGNTSIPSVMTDTDPAVIQATKDGYVTGFMASNAYAQAYLAAYSLKLLSEGCTFTDPDKFLFGIPYTFVDPEGADLINQSLEDQAKEIASTWKQDLWTCPDS